VSIGRKILCFGPSQAAARIETSKSFSKAFMARHGIPGADYASFRDFGKALKYMEGYGKPFVVKASGLASGKGVFLPDTLKEGERILRSLMLERSLEDAGEEVLIEERLEGEELSLMVFCDGRTISPMPSSQDHKRLLDGDLGPNTGGMGAYAPAPICPDALAAEYARRLVQPVVDGLAAEGCPFVGVLYAGLMITAGGPKVLEFNCRFGDPETQVLMPLFDGDLAPVLVACAEGRLDQISMEWKPGAAVCVVLASEGYPEAPVGGQEILGLDEVLHRTFIFHAGTTQEGDRVLARAGRVLGVASRGESLRSALDSAYARLERITLPGARFRRDIGRKGLRAEAEAAAGASRAVPDAGDRSGSTPVSASGADAFRAMQAARFPERIAARQMPAPSAHRPAGAEPTMASVSASASTDRSVSASASTDKSVSASASAYASAGVDIDAGNRAVELMSGAVKATYTPAVLAGIGSFGGLFDAAALKAMEAPVLVASTDGVGTKVKLAAEAGSYASIGADIVNHCIDDILVQGARPLFFLDYFASSKLVPAQAAQIVTGMADACRLSGCVLIGGETAEMPGVYMPGEFDVAGTIVGLVERSAILPRKDLDPDDLLVGFRSNSPHTNGYSLIRKVFEGVSLDTVYPELGRPLGEVLLAPHRSYLPLLGDVLARKPGLVKALAHITGGGFIENIPRILPPGIDASIRAGSWPLPPLYDLIRRLGSIPESEMYRVFNMGIGMVAVIDPERLDELYASISETFWVIGRLERSAGGPTIPGIARME
jgi:phosphoribosylformylglycinamidine cyclo-ligase/phosphoribosylamine--glycine ligase/phosphoribosylformylglycinamidine cyclo-ligase